MADGDDESSFDWQPDGTQPLDPDTDSSWTEPEEPPPADVPPVTPPAAPPPVVEPSVPAPPVEPPAPPPDAPAVAPPPDAPEPPAVDWTAPSSDQWTGRRRRSGWPVGRIVGLAAVATLVGLGAVAYAVGHSASHRLAGPPATRNCPDPTYDLSTAATAAPRATAGRASGSTRTSHKRHLAFTLPPGWQPASSEDVLYGYEDRCGAPQIVLSSVATFGAGYCPAQPSAHRAIAGVRGAAGEHDVGVAARDVAAAWATWAYAGKQDEQPHVVVSHARPFTARGTRGSLVRATARGTVPLQCGAERGVVYAIAVDSTDGADVFVVSADQGASADPTDADLLAVAGSLHRVP